MIGLHLSPCVVEASNKGISSTAIRSGSIPLAPSGNSLIAVRLASPPSSDLITEDFVSSDKDDKKSPADLEGVKISSTSLFVRPMSCVASWPCRHRLLGVVGSQGSLDLFTGDLELETGVRGVCNAGVVCPRESLRARYTSALRCRLSEALHYPPSSQSTSKESEELEVELPSSSSGPSVILGSSWDRAT